VNNLAQNNGATGINGNECDAARVPFQNRILFLESSTVAIMHGCVESNAAQEAGKAELSVSW
jgi:hypothetical protein